MILSDKGKLAFSVGGSPRKRFWRIKLSESRIDSLYRRMELGGYWGLLRLFLRPVFRPHGKPRQARLEFR